jgi:YidC/Oxa1 family membrane protein insertase
MSDQPLSANPLVRLLVPLVLLLVGIGVMWSVSRNTGRQSASTTPAAATQPAVVDPVKPDATSSKGAGAEVTSGGVASESLTTVGVAPATPSMQAVPPGAPAAPATPMTYRASVFAGDPLATKFTPLGDLDPAKARGRLSFSSIGAGIAEYAFAEHHQDWKKSAHYVAQHEHRVEIRQADGSVVTNTLTPMAALALQINGGAFVVLATDPAGPTWRQVSADRAGVFEAFVEDSDGRRVLRIERAYSVESASHEIRLRQTVTNLSDQAMTIRWIQLGPADLPLDSEGYGGDKRRVRFGYLLPAAVDPTRQVVSSNEYQFLWRHETLGSAGGFGYSAESPIWPDARATDKKFELAWAGMTNRYFGAAVHPPVDPSVPVSSVGSTSTNKQLLTVGGVDRVLLNRVKSDGTLDDPVMAMRFTSPAMMLGASGTLDLSMGFWVGPLSKPLLSEEPAASAMGLAGLVVYNLGGPCAPCTFDFITFILRSVMHFLHDTIFHDWTLAIVFLVVFVRTCLHPLTRWSQIRMQRFGKQMQLMAPKQKKIQEKFKDEPKKMQEEMAKLWREEGVSPFGMLGCLPMLAVTPIWMSLYALLYFAVELRNEPAFYGLIQRVTGGNWGFMADLSHPDRLIDFGTSFHVPLLSAMLGPISSLNILPLLLGVVFYFHQKFLTPPTTMELTPDQKAQQRMIKVMSVVMFPLFMYNAPAGLAVYFTTNSLLAIVENGWIRKHIDKHGLLEEENLKKKINTSGKKGFMQRLMEAAEEKRKLAEAAARRQQLERGKSNK